VAAADGERAPLLLHSLATLREVILPALDRGASVICDRYVDSSVAYQGVGRGLGLDRVLGLNLDAVGGLLPDRTFLLLLDPAEVPSRLTGAHDRLEREDDAFRTRVAAGYRELASRFPERIVPLDATLPPDVIAEEVYGALRVRSLAGRGEVAAGGRAR